MPQVHAEDSDTVAQAFRIAAACSGVDAAVTANLRAAEGVEAKTLFLPLQGKDWTRYEGVLHTDHAVRDEFFQGRDDPPTATRPYLMDFTYLYDENQADFLEFTGGKQITEDEIFAEIGRQEDWTHRKSAQLPTRSEADAMDVALQIIATDTWQAPARYAALSDD